MIIAGIDSGSQNTKGILLCDGKIIASAKTTTEFDANQAAQNVLDQLVKQSQIKTTDIQLIATTGSGRGVIHIVDQLVNPVDSASSGAFFVADDTSLIIDMGAESSRVIRLDNKGIVKKYETNDKCASGAGMFIEAMARALQIKTKEMGDYSLRHKKEIVTNAQCVVFAESEVISLIHRNETQADIAYAIHIGICNRVASLIRRIGLADSYTMIGGPAYNKGLVACMQKVLGKPVFVPEAPDYISAIGAALVVAKKL